MTYERTQIGWWFSVNLILVIIAISLAYYFQIGDRPLPSVFQLVVFVLILILINFYKLKLKVDQTGINILYGIGLVHIKIQPERIESVKPIKTKWITGFGIRITMNGMLYNIQGREAVKITYYKNGSLETVNIGCENAMELATFLNKKYHTA